MSVDIVVCTVFRHPFGKNICRGVLSDQGGKAEVNLSCSVYVCIYPRYTLGRSGFHYGVDYPDNLKDFGTADKFAQTRQCGGPFGPNSTYCATVIINEKKQ